ncbi:hypothetical protein SteCoe_33747 [Stentor coeruleus]|uniref:C2 domain-containing protein n=1 Tax=Stentor coeruleus TaxID=5963 RepID=A0A1R2AW39_9CILI|nr:hypothetical protein SteCoe_33747 [Stentor coeruleus]
MGNCTKINLKPYTSKSTQLSVESDSSRTVKFNVKITKLKIRDLNAKIHKGRKLAANFVFPSEFFKFSEKASENDIFRWEESASFIYEANLYQINNQKLEINVLGKGKTVCSTEIKIRSIIDGPVHQNTCLTVGGLLVGRISFDIEFLEETCLTISAEFLNFYLEDDNIGNFSTSLKYASDTAKESDHSSITDSPSWKFKASELLCLNLNVTMKNIRDAALQMRLYKHHKDQISLSAECWVSFTKLFAQDMGTIYRKESMLEFTPNKSESQLDFEKILKALSSIHNKKISEELWLCGRKVGALEGMLKIIGMPTFVQLISGVNTESGITVQNINVISYNKGKKKKNLPSQIIEIQKLTNKLKGSIQIKTGKVGPGHEREIFKYKKELIDRICLLLEETTKESIVCYTYTSSKSLLKSQKSLIDLGRHLVEYAPLVNYDIKPYYFKCILLVINRGELDIGHLCLINLSNTLLEEKINIARIYYTMVQEVLQLSLSRMVFKGIDDVTQDYVNKTLAIGWFRIPEFREHIKDLVKKKSYYSIPEWRNIESNLDEDEDHNISNPLDWGNFYNILPKDIKNEGFTNDLHKEDWRLRFEKRGVAFFSFFEEWVEHVHKQSISQHFIWSCIPGYKILLKAFLIEMKERKIIEYPEALISCACKILYDKKMLNVLIKILFCKTNVYDFNAVQETFQVMNRLFISFYQLKHKLPNTFDNEYFILGLRICLEDENALNIAKALWFLYNQYHMISGVLRKEIIYEIVIKKMVYKFFYHWSKEVRNMFQHFIVFRVLSLEDLCFENCEDNHEINDMIRKKIRRFIKRRKVEKLKKGQVAYFDMANEEYEKVLKEYEEWKKNLGGDSGKLYGVSDKFPYPEINTKLNYIDLAERRMEEQW